MGPSETRICFHISHLHFFMKLEACDEVSWKIIYLAHSLSESTLEKGVIKIF